MPPGDIEQCLETASIVKSGWGTPLASTGWGARDAAKHPAVHRTALPSPPSPRPLHNQRDDPVQYQRRFEKR